MSTPVPLSEMAMAENDKSPDMIGSNLELDSQSSEE